MKTYRTLLALPLLAVTSFALGCGGSDSPTDPTGNSGSVSFSYSGAISGSYTATGAVQWMGFMPQFGTFAVGFWEDNELGILASRAGTASRSDVFSLDVENIAGPRTVAISADCITNCAYVAFLPNLNWNTFDSDRLCYLESGSVQVTAINAQRAQGSFSGQGVCLSVADETEGTFTITNGSFDVPIMQ